MIGTNLIIIFGCSPELRVSAFSPLTSKVFARFQSVVNKADNSLRLPLALINWQIPGNGELLMITTQTLLLENVFSENSSISNIEEEKKEPVVELPH